MGHTIATIFLPRSYCQTYSENSQGWVLSFNRTMHHALAHRARDSVAFLERKVPDFVSPTLWSTNSPYLNSNDYSMWSVGLMQEKVYRSRIANVNELEMRLIDEWGRFNSRSWMLLLRPVTPSSQCLTCPWSGAHFKHQA